ncbi:unnamed protein product [Meloidogyne enterolobii]|uniref:Uncharacterized protein n=1 Tax=Meloidogyne enterolobii TaxID=390850 RepID=A0ACB0Y3H9_MELEN
MGENWGEKNRVCMLQYYRWNFRFEVFFVLFPSSKIYIKFPTVPTSGTSSFPTNPDWNNFPRYWNNTSR